MGSLVNYEIQDDHIAVLTLNRPESMNALSGELLHELNTYIDTIKATESIRCTIITGAGDKAFCAGADLKERKGMNEQQTIEAVSTIGDTATKIEAMGMPVIAALNGAALGGGLELALACDIRIAAAHAKLGLTETSLAIIPGAGGTQRMTRLIGAGQTKRLIFTASRVTGDEALQLGLVEQTSSSGRILSDALDMADVITQNGPVAVKQAKTAINQGAQTDLGTALAIEQLCYKEIMTTNDRLEGLQAFRDKRKPVYQGL